MIGFEENEISVNANGGTELIKRKLAGMLDENLLSQFQIVPSRIRDLDESKIRLLWSHDLPEDPEANKTREVNFRNKFHQLVFVSNWQYQRYQLVNGIPYDSKSVVIEHGIDPSPVTCLEKPKDKIRLAYTSTPQRGLEILVPVFMHLAKENPDIHLDVFSSFKIYGWDDHDKNFEELYKQIEEHPQMTYHGYTPNDQLREQLNSCHIHAYPSIWMETACIALMEAMSSGLVCVHPNYGALPETSGGLNIMYNGHQDMNQHANIFASHLNAAIALVRENKEADMIRFNKFYADNKYDIRRAKQGWESLLGVLLETHPDEVSRKFQSEMFSYKVG
jgi:glycosyltransferase involved in cell wall biosynthesis